MGGGSHKARRIKRTTRRKSQMITEKRREKEPPVWNRERSRKLWEKGGESAAKTVGDTDNARER